MEQFKDRREAGRVLAQDLSAYANRADVLVFALPRGGVPVAYEVAMALNAPLDVFIVRKLGVPGHEELAIGAIASGAIRVLNEDIVRALHIPQDLINAIARRELLELQRREQTYRGSRPPLEAHAKTVILVDDGLATGASIRAAVTGVRTHHPARIVIAVPTAAPETCNALAFAVDEIVCSMTPDPFLGVGRWYEDFSQVTDEQVHTLLEDATHQLLNE